MGRGRKIFKRVDNSDILELSKEQKEILNYLLEEFLTPQQIANIRGTSVKAVYKTISKLKNKGIIKGVEKSNYIRGVGKSSTPQSDKEEYRLHALSYKINIINSSPKYEQILKTRNKDELDNNTMMLYQDFLIIYLNKDFYGKNPDECFKKSLEYINRFIIMLENNYKFILKKGRQFELMQFKSEIAKTNDEFAKKCNLEKEKIKIYDNNGILRLIVDNSFNLNELEAVNNTHNLQDMNKIDQHKTHLKALITNNILSPVEMHQKIEQLINLQEITTLQIGNLIKLLKEK